ncbi:hypothetical protein BH09BAC5_BH09BAC5_20930 [soil metagenome]
MKSRILFLIFILPLSLVAQRDTIAPCPTTLYLGGSVQYGFLWSHRYNMGHLVQKHLVAFELDLTKTTSGDRCWQNPFHYPSVGVTIQVIPLGNPDELGTAIGLYPFINFPLGDRNRKIKSHLRLGYGLGYITNPFDPIENHKNVAIGSHYNACISLRLNEIWQMNDKNYLEFGLGMTHFSDGALKLPNLGLNIPLVNFGFHHSISTNAFTKVNPELETKNKHTIEILTDPNWHINVLLSAGHNDIDPPGGNRFGLINIQSSITKRTAWKHRWGAGLDLMYSDALRRKLALDTIHVSVVENLQPGAKFCYEFVVGRLSFPIEMGAYLYTRYKLFGPVYNRFAVHYLVNNHLLFNISLKTHFARAEYFEFGAGWRF